MIRRRKTKRRTDPRRHAGHLQWIRGLECIIGRGCDGSIEACHVDYAGTGPEKKAMGVKVPDWFVVPMCSRHHAEQHDIGWARFERRYQIDAESTSGFLRSISPHHKQLAEMCISLMEKFNDRLC